MGAVVVQNLGKTYRSYRSRWGRLASWFGVKGGIASEHWVFRNVSFELQPGEAVGIIGRNGAGKSTLLKLLTGITLPNEGSVCMSGRVSALLELGIGFHPYLTGRQNAFMAGSLIGLSRDDVARLMPEIEAFAEIGEYIDQPVRVYSSGMQARLAFSVATAVRPDVLIVDEVLSVGDAYFQHKSFDRIREFRKRGTTLLIVSHDKQAIQSICDRAILLDSGRLATIGKPEAVLDYYNALLSRHQNPQIVQSERSDGRMKTVSGTGEATIEDVSLLDMENNKLSLVAVGQKILISILVCVHQDIDSLVLGCGIKDRFGQMVFGTNTFNTRQVLTDLKKGERYVYTISFSANLGVGSYSIHASLVRNSSHIERNYQWLDGAVVFEVFNKDKVDFVGCCWNEMNFAVNKVLE
jgi:lipopolysaccharide transport system ATP-binding protein